MFYITMGTDKCLIVLYCDNHTLQHTLAVKSQSIESNTSSHIYNESERNSYVHIVKSPAMVSNISVIKKLVIIYN